MPTTEKQILEIRGKGAVFIRGYLESDSKRLRERQEAGNRAVEELGGEISISYISKLSKMLEAAKVLKKTKVGRSYEVEVDDDKAELILEVEEYGTSVSLELKDSEVMVRSDFAEYLDKHQMVLNSVDNRLPKEAFRLAMERFTKGELVTVFVTPKKAKQLRDKKGKTPQVWKP